MTRSEEELKVGTAQRETGRARLRRYVVTEDVQKTVPVRREEVRVEREPITEGNVDDATDGPAISEEEHELTLHAEEPVVEKRAVRRSGSVSTRTPSRRTARCRDRRQGEDRGRRGGGRPRPRPPLTVDRQQVGPASAGPAGRRGCCLLQELRGWLALIEWRA